MTNELEKQFFNTFGIDPKKQCYYWDCPYSTGNIVKDTPMNERDCNSCKNPDKEIYPQITDSILLKLICILSEWKQYCISYNVIDAVNINTLKEDILRDCICMSHWYEFNRCGKDIKHQVCALFEEG